MNLAEIRDEVENELKWSPGAEAHKRDLTRVINRVYLSLCAEQLWLFLEKTADIEIFPDFQTSVVAKNRYTVQTAGLPLPVDVRMTQGCYLVSDTDAKQPHRINSIGDGIAGGFEEFTHVQTEEEVLAYSGVGDTMFFEWRSRLLPDDCEEILGIVSRDDDRGEIFHIDTATEQRRHLDKDDRSDWPTVYKLVTWPEIEQPRQALAGVLAAGGTLTVGTTYRYCYVYEYAGLISGRSNIVSITPTPGNQTVNLSNIEVGDGPAGGDQGHKRHLYKDNGDGILRRWAGFANTLDVTASDTGAVAATGDPIPDTGPRPAIEFWPRPPLTTDIAGFTSSSIKVELRYHRRPDKLIFDEDVPSIPKEFHHILVHLSLVELCRRFGDGAQSDLHAKIVDKEKLKMQRRYVDESARKWVKEPYSEGSPGRTYRPKVTFV